LSDWATRLANDVNDSGYREILDICEDAYEDAYEAFGGLDLLAEDRKFVSTKAKVLIAISTLLKNASLFVRPLIHFADSVYVVSIKQ
jgi:hypothetical protein